MFTPIVLSARRSHHKPGKRDAEIVSDGLAGYTKIAGMIYRRYFRFAFTEHEEAQQVIALAALEALALLGEDAPMGEVTRAVRFVIRRQATAAGWHLIDRRKENGQRTANWGKWDIASVDDPKDDETSHLTILGRNGVRYVGVGEYSQYISHDHGD